jgi:hypothetical protein
MANAGGIENYNSGKFIEAKNGRLFQMCLTKLEVKIVRRICGKL